MSGPQLWTKSNCFVKLAASYVSVNETLADDAARRLMSLGRNEVILVEECQSKHELETTFKK